MRILFYGDDIDGAGGAAAFVHDLALEMRQRGHEVAVATATWPHLQGPRQCRLAAGIDEFALALGPGWVIRLREAEPAGVMTAYRPQVVFFTDCQPGSNLGAKRVARRLGLPFVSKISLADPQTLEDFLALPPDCRDWGDDGPILFISEGNRRRSCAMTGLDPAKTAVLSVGFPTAAFARPDPDSRRTRREEAGIPDDAFLCLTVARVEERKGDWLLPLIAAKMPAESRIHFLWIGHDLAQRAARLAAAMADAGYAERFRHLPAQPAERIPSWLAAADVFLLPTYGEGFGRVLVEAAAQGRPIVTADVDGAEETVGDSCGEVVAMDRAAPDATATRFAAALAAFEGDPERRARLGAAAAARARERFSMEVTLAGVEGWLAAAIRMGAQRSTSLPTKKGAFYAGLRCYGLDNPVLDDAAMADLAGVGWGRAMGRNRVLDSACFTLHWPRPEWSSGARSLSIRMKAIRCRKGALIHCDAAGRRLATWRLPAGRSRWLHIRRPRECDAAKALALSFSVDWGDGADPGCLEVSRIAFVPPRPTGWLGLAGRVAATRAARWIETGLRHYRRPSS